MAIGREAPSRLISAGGRADDSGLEVRGLALIRFDFVLHENREEVMGRLGDAFGEAHSANREDGTKPNVGDHSIFTGDPSRLGFGDGFDSLSVHIIDSTEPVTEIRTVVTVAPRHARGRPPLQRSDWQAWERNLESVRRFIPGEARGPETTVWWIDVAPLPSALEGVTSDPDTAERERLIGGNREIQEVVEITTHRGSVFLDGMAILVPGADDPSVGRLTGRLIAFDLVEAIGRVVESGGLDIPGSWSPLSSLLAIEYWALTMTSRIEAFEDRLDTAVAAIDHEAHDIGTTRQMVSQLFELEADWAALESRFERELRISRRRLIGVRTGGPESSEVSGFSGEIRDRSGGVLETYLDRLDTELESTRFDADRVAERLASVSRLLGTRASLLAARENLTLQGAISGRTGIGHHRETTSLRIGPIVTLLALILAADALMSGGLERFIDRLFDEGFAALTPQVIAGLGMVLLVIVAAIALSHRAAIKRFVLARRR